jgi:DMSO/TMAO reductase YedYZ molybdopterin-dependent catalytic subunit
VWAITLRWLTSASQPANRTPAEADPDAAPGAGAPRRAVLLGILALGAGAALVGAAGTFIGNRVRGDIDALRRTLRLPTPSEPAAPLDPNVQVPVDGVSEFRTRNDDFYRVDTALIVPNVDPQSWTLTVLGMVREPYTLSFDDLLAMPMIERDITLTCVSNEVGGPYVGTARWLGVPLRSLLTRAGVDRAADQLLSRSADGFTAGTPMPIALDFRDAMVAVGMNGEPLPVQHGFPARLVIPGLYGFVSATKWLVELKATTYAAEQAYWTRRGWATDAPIRTMARVEVPRPLSSVRSGTTAIAGTAWAQHRGIEGVEVQVDGGAWEPARLGSVPSADTWRQWWLPWNATPGRHVIRARATDSEGRTQPEARLTPFPSGAQGWHEVVVTVS